MTDPSIYPGQLWTSAEWNYMVEFHTIYVRKFDSHHDWAAEMDRRFEVTMILFDRMTNQLDCTFAAYGMDEEAKTERRELTVKLRIQLIRLETVIQERQMEWELEQASNK